MRSSWDIQKSVIRALIMREMKTRFGAYNLGYAWALLEPLAHVLVMVFIFTAIKARKGLFGVEFALYFAAGIITFKLFSNVAKSGSAAVSANKGLFNYRQVKPFDAFTARAILESAITLASFIVLLLLFFWWGYEINFKDPLAALLVFILLILLGLGLGLLLGTATLYTSDATKISNLLFQPLYFLSGVIFPIGLIPQPYQSWLLLNPIAHAVELVRESWFGVTFAEGVSLSYLSTWTLCTLTVGLLAYRSHWRQMVAT